MPRRTLIVGYGKLGGCLAALLLADGGEVVALRRRVDTLPPGVVGVSADLSRPLGATLPAVEAMVITLPPSGVVVGYRAALTNLAGALPKIPTRTVFVSSTGVYEGMDVAQALTEADEPPVRTERSRNLRDGERAAIELFDAVIVRPAGIYGPGREFLLRKVLQGDAVDHARRQIASTKSTSYRRSICC